MQRKGEGEMMAHARLVKRKIYTPMGKPDGYTYDLYVGKRVRTRSMGYKIGQRYVRKLNKLRR